MEVSSYCKSVYEATIIENAELNLVHKFNATLFMDGGMWCWLFGENIHDGVAGFGKSPYLAALDFNKKFRELYPISRENKRGASHE